MLITAKTEKEIIIDPTCLKSILQRIVSGKIFGLISWSYSPLGESKEESSIYRITCSVRISNDRIQDYSLIMKILKPDSTRNQADHYYYWKREALVYDSGILNQLPQGIRAPKCHAIEEHTDGSVRIWLEDIAIEAIQNDWSLRHMCDISYLLGKFNRST